MKKHNVFAGGFVDRCGHRRQDREWLTHLINSPDARFAPVWNEKCLINGDPPRVTLFKRSVVDPMMSVDEAVFLGMFGKYPAFAFSLACDAVSFPKEGQFHKLHYLGAVLPTDEANLVAHAIALIKWHQLQQFCRLCGSLTRAESAGNTRRCTSPKCGVITFPRVDPAIIVLVSHGDKALLGRQASWPKGRYSTIAGFVEPGESLEDAVRREVFEETNIEVGKVHYHSSQPWPFPSSLMLGFTAEAVSNEIILQDGELEDARWFTRKECRSPFPKLPFPISIARRLVDTWLDRE
jgi:NAD+ diphosphatase